MKNKSVSDMVAHDMDQILKSASHRSLFETQYKTAGEHCEEEHDHSDDCSDASDKEEVEEDESDASDKEELEASADFDVAIDSLLVASASLDNLGFEKGSSVSLKLASLVVEAKKKAKDEDFAAKMEALRAKKKKDKDAQMAKDKVAKEKEKAAKEKEKEKLAKEKEKAKEKAEKEKAAKKKLEEKEKAAKEKAKK